MPDPTDSLFSLPTPEGVRVALEPAHNAIHSLLLVTMADDTSGLGDWVYRTRATLSQEERETHDFVMTAFHLALTPTRSWPSFPLYLDFLAHLPPEELLALLLNGYIRLPILKEGYTEDKPPAFSSILASFDTYFDFLKTRFGLKWLDTRVESRAYEYLQDPPAMQKLIVNHLRHMWERYLAEEWNRVEPILWESVQAFQQIDFTNMDLRTAGQRITGQSPADPKWDLYLERFQRFFFVPNAHIGPYIGKTFMGDAMGILFGARLPEGISIHAPDLSRAEILVRLNALTDDTRLHILQMVAERGEMRSQEIMQALQLSQPTASRHLSQLVATGCLLERRCDGSKCYSLNLAYIENTLQAIARLLLGKAEPAGPNLN